MFICRAEPVAITSGSLLVGPRGWSLMNWPNSCVPGRPDSPALPPPGDGERRANASSNFIRNKCIFVQEFPGGTMISAHPQCSEISCPTQTGPSARWSATLVTLRTGRRGEGEGRGTCARAVGAQPWIHKYVRVCRYVCVSLSGKFIKEKKT